MKGLKNIVFIVILAGLSIPLLQQWFSFATENPLKGAYTIPDKPLLNDSTWLGGDFQDHYSEWYEYNFGFRPFFIRLRNQLHYEMYHKSTTYVVPGKEGQLYSWDYWSAYRGMNYLGEDSLEVKFRHLAYLNDSLKKMGKPLLCVIAPNKVRYMPEFMPDNYNREPGANNNYKGSVELLKKYNIPLLDLNRIFVEMKDTAKYTLFANTSTHWSGYGMNLGMKWMIERLEVLGDKDLINLNFSNWALLDSALDSDRDMIDLMNLMFPIETEPLAFPEFDFSGQDSAQPAKVLIIGDSFFWNYYSFEERFKIFHKNTRFWYYNKTQRELNSTMKSVDELRAREILKTVDFVVILATESNMIKFPYGFPEKFLAEQD